MPGEIGKEAAEELKSKVEGDEASLLAHESDENYQARVLECLDKKLQPEIQAFNGAIGDKAADFLMAKKSSGMLQVTRGNIPVFAALPKGRELYILPPDSTAPATNFRVSGGPEEFSFDGTSEADFFKTFIKMAVSGELRK